MVDLMFQESCVQLRKSSRMLGVQYARENLDIENHVIVTSPEDIRSSFRGIEISCSWTIELTVEWCDPRLQPSLDGNTSVQQKM